MNRLYKEYEMSVPSKIENYLKENKYHFLVMKHSPTERAIENLATAKCPPSQLAKVLVFDINKKRSFVILPSNELVHLGTLKESLQTQDVKMLGEEDLENSFKECEIGATPPLGGLYNMPVYLSNHFQKDQEMYFNGGTHTDLILMPYQEFLIVEHPQITNFSVPIEDYIDYKDEFRRSF